MTQMFVGAGVACVVAAAVGGGLKMAGTEIPALKSIGRQVLVAVLGLALIAGGFALPDGDGDDAVAADDTSTTEATKPSTQESTRLDPSTLQSFPDVFERDTTITLSRSSGPPGTVFRVSGSGFDPGERVEIRFHTRVLGEVRADSRGDFEGFETQVPDSPFRNVQRQVSATGQSSIRTASKPFDVT